MEMTLVNKTKDHNLYRTNVKRQMLYQITKKNDPKPTTGYWSASHVLKQKGYSKEDAHKMFDMVGRNLEDPLKPEIK